MLKKIEEVDRRSYGLDGKTKNFRVQLASSLIFGAIGVSLFSKLNNQLYFYLFTLEAIGQLFLAVENKISLNDGNLQISYFRRNWLGFCALSSFLIVLFVRYLLISNQYPSYANFLNIFSLVQVVVAMIFFLSSTMRKDWFFGILLFSSALFLGLVQCTQQSTFAIGINQILYAMLLMLGTLFLKPWIAEMLNILIWIHLFFLIY